MAGGLVGIFEHLEQLTATANVARVSGWTGSITIEVAGEPWTTCRVDLDGVHLNGPPGGVVTILRATSEEAVEQWLVGGVDFTHLVASGQFRIEGVYFDVLLLSKVLGLRPERKVSRTS